MQLFKILVFVLYTAESWVSFQKIDLFIGTNKGQKALCSKLRAVPNLSADNFQTKVLKVESSGKKSLLYTILTNMTILYMMITLLKKNWTIHIYMI